MQIFRKHPPAIYILATAVVSVVVSYMLRKQISRMQPQIFSVLIIGGGPAGLTAALACARTKSTALVFDSGEYRNEGITHMHTVPSRDHSDPYEFRRIAREQISSRYHTVSFEKTKVTSAVKKVIDDKGYEGFEVKDEEGREWFGRKLLLATGSKDILPDIEGYKENWPQHIYQCLGCDGYEQSGTPIGILDFSSPMQTHLAGMAMNFDNRVTIFSNGSVSEAPEIQSALNTALALGAKLDTRTVTRMTNNGPSHHDGITLHFTTGDPVTLGFVVHRPPTVNRAQRLIEMLGVETTMMGGGQLVTTNGMFGETSVKGVFAAGDTMTAMKQVVVAMAEGLRAVAGAGMQLGQEDAEAAVRAKKEKGKGGEELK